MESIKASNYQIHFNTLGYKELSSFIEKEKFSSIFILVDTNSLEFCYPKFISNLETNIPIEVIEIDAGEEFKNLETCLGIWNAMIELGADRSSLLITLGGGVITDMGGFVASCFKRGIDFVNIPTTLLSMVDASVGGKTGIDLGNLKNQIGVFANPKMVIVDHTYLNSLPKRQFLSGKAEIIKYALTHDKSLLENLEFLTQASIEEIIHKSIAIKNLVVLNDPKEVGERKVLNFGHTIGHAIESYFLESQTKSDLTHGEAIAIGMICEAYLSHRILGFSKSNLNLVHSFILNLFGKVMIEKDDYSPIIDLLKHDKKNVGGQVTFVLLNKMEDFNLNCTASTELVIESLDYYNNLS